MIWTHFHREQQLDSLFYVSICYTVFAIQFNVSLYIKSNVQKDWSASNIIQFLSNTFILVPYSRPHFQSAVWCGRSTRIVEASKAMSASSAMHESIGGALDVLQFAAFFWHTNSLHHLLLPLPRKLTPPCQNYWLAAWTPIPTRHAPSSTFNFETRCPFSGLSLSLNSTNQ